MKYTYIFTVANGLTEDDLCRLAQSVRMRTISYRLSHSHHLYDSVQVFTVPGEMHRIAHAAGFSGEQLRVALPAAQRRGDMAVKQAYGLQQGDTGQLLENRVNECEDKACTIESAAVTQTEDTVMLDWLQENQALVNMPNLTPGLAHVAYLNEKGGREHVYGENYRDVIRRAMATKTHNRKATRCFRYRTPMQMPGGTKRSKRSA